MLWSLYLILFLLVSVSYSGNINLIWLLFIFITALWNTGFLLVSHCIQRSEGAFTSCRNKRNYEKKASS